MPQENVLGRVTNRTSSPSLSDRVRSFAGRKPRVPSAARTVSADDADTEAESTVESDDGQSLPQRIKSDPSAYHNENVIQSLDSSKPVAERLALIRSIANETKSYRLASIMAILGSIQDLSGQQASPEARKAVFDLAQALALHPEQSHEGRARIFAMAITPIDSQHLDLQTKCLRYITARGSRVETFAKDLVVYMNQALGEQIETVFEIRRKLKNSAKRAQSPEERGLYGLLSLARDVVENSPKHLTPADQAILLDHLLAITERTTSTSDMKRTVAVLNASIQSWGIPSSHANMVIEILCAVSSAVSDLRDEIKKSLLQELRSKKQAEIVRILLQTLALSPQDRHTHTVCGTLSIVCYLVENRGAEDLPAISFAQFIESFWKVHFASRRVRRDCLSTITALLENSELKADVLKSDWQHMIETVLTATGDETYTPGQSEPLLIQQQSSGDHSPSPSSEASNEKAAAEDIYKFLKRISTALNFFWPCLVQSQRLLLARFYRELHAILPPSCLDDLVRNMTESGSLASSDENWQNNGIILVDKILIGQRVYPETYCEAIRGLKKHMVHEPNEDEGQYYWGMAKRLLNDYAIHQKGWKAASELAAFVVEIWRRAPPPEIQEIVSLLRNLIYAIPKAESEEAFEEQAQTDPLSMLGGVTSSLVDLVIHAMTTSNDQLMHTLFLTLVRDVAGNRDLLPVLRFPAMKLLFSLRKIGPGFLEISNNADGIDLAAAIFYSETSSHEAGLVGEQSTAPNERSSMRKSRSKTSSILAPFTTIGQSKGLRDQSMHHSQTRLWWYLSPPTTLTEFPSLTFEWSPSLERIRILEWTTTIIRMLEEEDNWEILSYFLVHLPSQLSNTALFTQHLPVIQNILIVVLRQLLSGAIREPPAGSGVKRGEVALCLYHSLVTLLGYISLLERSAIGEALLKSVKADLVRAFVTGISQWDRSGQFCVQALTICCHVIPSALAESLPSILEKMAQVITQSSLAPGALEFLGGLARLPHLHHNLEEEDYRRIFAICLKYLEHSREQRLKSDSRPGTGRGASAARSSGVSTRSITASELQNIDIQKALPQYVFVLAYHVLTIWFLAVKLPDRPKYVGRITSDLTWIDESGRQRIEEQGVVIVDMMNRAAYSNLGETGVNPYFDQATVRKSNWLVGLSIVSVATNPQLGLTQFTKRQASGTSHLQVTHLTHALPAHHQDYDRTTPDDQATVGDEKVFPSHFMLSLLNSAAPTPAPTKPIPLPPDDSVMRALSSFDRNNTVDGYKVAVIWYEQGVSNERDVLAASQHGPDFDFLLRGMGKKIQLKDAQFNTQGLNRFDNSDGEFTYAWRDRVVEMVYHIPTLMPTRLDVDLNCDNKKRHIGNDYVKIIYNVARSPFNPEIFTSAFNVVNIVVTPEKDHLRTVKPQDNEKEEKEDYDDEDANEKYNMPTFLNRHYAIEVHTPSGFPRIAPASNLKNIPGYALGGLVRQMALYACIFCNVWQFRSDGEYPSSWRNRLREITRLRARYASSGYQEGDAYAGTVQMGGIADEEGIALGMDISRWAGVP